MNVPDGSQVSILQRDRPLLIEFWDFCRPNSMQDAPIPEGLARALRRGGAARGRRALARDSSSSRDEDAVRAAVARLGIEYPVLIDSELELWREYENEGWPARYLFDGGARLFEYHFGEGGYERDRAGDPGAARRRARAALAACEPRTRRAPRWRRPRQSSPAPTRVRTRPAACGRCSAERASCASTSPARPGTASSSIEQPGAYPLIEHERHTKGVIGLELGEGVRVPRHLLHAGRGVSARRFALRQDGLDALLDQALVASSGSDTTRRRELRVTAVEQ